MSEEIITDREDPGRSKYSRVSNNTRLPQADAQLSPEQNIVATCLYYSRSNSPTPEAQFIWGNPKLGEQTKRSQDFIDMFYLRKSRFRINP